jgi:hypothetical protein
MLSVMARLVADAVLVGTLLFTAAGTLAWGRAWVLLAVMLFVRATGACVVYRVNPALLRDRARLPIHGDQPWTDRLLLIAVLSTGLLGLPVVAALRGRAIATSEAYGRAVVRKSLSAHTARTPGTTVTSQNHGSRARCVS